MTSSYAAELETRLQVLEKMADSYIEHLRNENFVMDEEERPFPKGSLSTWFTISYNLLVSAKGNFLYTSAYAENLFENEKKSILPLIEMVVQYYLVCFRGLSNYIDIINKKMVEESKDLKDVYDMILEIHKPKPPKYDEKSTFHEFYFECLENEKILNVFDFGAVRRFAHDLLRLMQLSSVARTFKDVPLDGHILISSFLDIAELLESMFDQPVLKKWGFDLQKFLLSRYLLPFISPSPSYEPNFFFDLINRKYVSTLQATVLKSLVAPTLASETALLKFNRDTYAEITGKLLSCPYVHQKPYIPPVKGADANNWLSDSLSPSKKTIGHPSNKKQRETVAKKDGISREVPTNRNKRNQNAAPKKNQQFRNPIKIEDAYTPPPIVMQQHCANFEPIAEEIEIPAVPLVGATDANIQPIQEAQLDVAQTTITIPAIQNAPDDSIVSAVDPPAENQTATFAVSQEQKDELELDAEANAEMEEFMRTIAKYNEEKAAAKAAPKELAKSQNDSSVFCTKENFKKLKSYFTPQKIVFDITKLRKSVVGNLLKIFHLRKGQITFKMFLVVMRHLDVSEIVHKSGSRWTIKFPNEAAIRFDDTHNEDLGVYHMDLIKCFIEKNYTIDAEQLRAYAKVLGL